MGLLGGTIKGGSWWLRSESDPKWNTEGSGCYVGGLMMPSECKEAVERLKKKYGSPPNDLEYGYMKD